MKYQDFDKQFIWTEVSFDSAEGWPTGKKTYYRCMSCNDVIPSLPDEGLCCGCRSLVIDVDAGRFSATAADQVRVLRVKGRKKKMSIKDPDIRAHFETIMAMDAAQFDPAVKPILALMDAFGSPRLRLKTGEPMPTDASWRPSSPEYKELIELLIAPENRDALRQWYAQFEGIETNESSDVLRQVLSEITGERLGNVTRERLR